MFRFSISHIFFGPFLVFAVKKNEMHVEQNVQQDFENIASMEFCDEWFFLFFFSFLLLHFQLLSMFVFLSQSQYALSSWIWW